MWLFEREGASGFSASSTAEQVTHGIDGTNLTAIVTGASSGIGLETARVLALRGVHVIMAVRDVNAGTKAKDTMLKGTPAAKIDVMELDLSSLASVRKFASAYLSLGIPLNILINNAGVMVSKFLLSKDNIELQFATNHLGHFLLTNLLLDAMKTTATQSNIEGKIINVSSVGHRFVYREGIQFDKINQDTRYKYGQSKLANILHSNELARRLKVVIAPETSTILSFDLFDKMEGSFFPRVDINVYNAPLNQEEGIPIIANSVHPGIVVTNLMRDGSFLHGFINMIGKYFFRNIQRGAATTCYVALNPQVKGVTGEYFSDSNIAKASVLANDPALAKKLWDFSLNLIESK